MKENPVKVYTTLETKNYTFNLKVKEMTKIDVKNTKEKKHRWYF